MMYTLRFDGLFRILHDPEASEKAMHGGFMSYGWLIFRGNALIAQGHGVYARGKNASSNLAEYLALIEGMEALRDLGVRHEPVEIIGDAKCVIDQMCGQAAVKSEQVKPLYRRAERLAQNFSRIRWTWLPRQKNREADRLTRRAIRQLHANVESYQEVLQTMLTNRSSRRKSGRLLPVLDLRVVQIPQ
jgi:ribonuclease HI